MSPRGHEISEREQGDPQTDAADRSPKNGGEQRASLVPNDRQVRQGNHRTNQSNQPRCLSAAAIPRGIEFQLARVIGELGLLKQPRRAMWDLQQQPQQDHTTAKDGRDWVRIHVVLFNRSLIRRQARPRRVPNDGVGLLGLAWPRNWGHYEHSFRAVMLIGLLG